MFTSTILAEIFTTFVTDARLALDEERETIAKAQGGDADATLALMRAYAPVLQNGVKPFTRSTDTAPQTADLEDVRSQAVVGFLEAIKAFDPERHDRLAAVVPGYVRNAVSVSAESVTGFTVPERTLKRFFGILRTADGNVYEAAALAPEYEMTTETFLSVLSAVRNVTSYDALTTAEHEAGNFTAGGQSGEGSRDVTASPVWDGATADAEDRILVEAAFRAVDTLEKDVCRMAYGFSDYDPIDDGTIGETLGLSRSKTQRTRTSALAKMRFALGVA